MPGLYKTPGVYVEEIPKFPPSVAPVETAIPAFIGYTEKAQKIKPDDLLNVPTKIGSIAEYEAYFGYDAGISVAKVALDSGKNFKSADIANQFFLYDNLRLFYANGGGDCYIVSTGYYATAARNAAEFTGTGKGIDALEKVDEPTILVFPDNSLLTTGSDFYAVYDAALAHCGKLMDRVGLFHVKKDDANGTAFRSGTGSKDLKYGAAYTPWLHVNFPKNITLRDFKSVIFVGSSNAALSTLTSSSSIQTLITEYEQVMTDADTIKAATTALLGGFSSFGDRYNDLQTQFLTTPNNAKLQAIANFLYDFARKLDVLVGAGVGSVGDSGLKAQFKALITSTLKGTYTDLITKEGELKSAVASYTVQYSIPTVPTAAEWGTIFAAAPAAGPVTTLAQLQAHLPAIFDQINAAWSNGIIETAQTLEKQKHEGLLEAFSLYKTIISGIQNASSAVPPSGAVAGIYAYTDSTRGVWKAPANTSISSIIGPTDTFTASQLDALNMDANSGKSINAIRGFTGKGTLVFGARTLAGNDNEWRYVSVRRFFNFVEESVKKATEQFVFEPNDANTWVRVQAMIENFLTTLWRQGALQGVKPEHAFYVAVGLGKTMTPLDILEGRMIVEIGMAAVRPAEFIILKFSHKMAES